MGRDTCAGTAVTLGPNANPAPARATRTPQGPHGVRRVRLTPLASSALTGVVAAPHEHTPHGHAPRRSRGGLRPAAQSPAAAHTPVACVQRRRGERARHAAAQAWPCCHTGVGVSGCAPRRVPTRPQPDGGQMRWCCMRVGMHARPHRPRRSPPSSSSTSVSTCTAQEKGGRCTSAARAHARAHARACAFEGHGGRRARAAGVQRARVMAAVTGLNLATRTRAFARLARVGNIGLH